MARGPLKRVVWSDGSVDESRRSRSHFAIWFKILDETGTRNDQIRFVAEDHAAVGAIARYTRWWGNHGWKVLATEVQPLKLVEE